MGCEVSSESLHPNQKNHISVVTLNYGGILNSPMEFFSNTQTQQHEISVIFRQLIPQYFKDFNQKTFKWDVGKIDQKLQKQRYTPIYRANVGIQKGKLIGTNEFQRRWQESFNQARSQKKVQPEPTLLQVQNMKTFDLICYHTLVKFVYKIKSLKQVESGDFSPSKYSSLTQKYFNRSYLNQQKKITKVKQALIKNSSDIFFFQQPTKQFIEQLKKDTRFFVKQKGPGISMLLIRRTSFKIIDDQSFLKSTLNEKQLEELNWDGDTCYVVCDRFIFISGHLSSKKQKNAKQVQEMKESLRILRRKCPEHHIIVGADTNSFVTTSGIQQFHSYPSLSAQFTTRKKRTFMQPQFNKADAINEECKDQIFTTLKMVKTKIMTIENQQVDDKEKIKKLLPTEQHPFDHFMVLCYLEKPEKRLAK